MGRTAWVSALFLSTALSLSAAAPAWACPAESDLARGLIFSFETRDRGGASENMAIYSRLAEDGRIATTFYPQLTGDPWESFKHAGLLDAEAQRRSGGQRAEGVFDPELMAALPPQPNTTLSGDARWTRAGQNWTARYEITTGDVTETTLGDCTYSAFPLTLRETRILADGSERLFQSEGMYVPELLFFNTPPARSVSGFTGVRTPRFTERFNWPFRGL